MNSWRVTGVFLGLLLLAAPASAGGEEETERARLQAAIAKLKVPMTQAIESATQQVTSGKPYKAELMSAREGVMYSIELVTGGSTVAALVDAVQGKLIKIATTADEESEEESEAGKKDDDKDEESEEEDDENDEGSEDDEDDDEDEDEDEDEHEEDDEEEGRADEDEELAEAIKALGAAKITMVQAVQIALNELKGATPYEAELEMVADAPQYEVDVLAGDKLLEVKIDAVAGKVLKIEEEDKEGRGNQCSTFDQDQVGKTPDGLLIKQNNPTKELGKWTVEADSAAPSKPNVLSLRTVNGNATFNLAIFEKVKAKDVELSVALRGNSGQHDQGGGLMWRVKDENNYYICRINPLEPNVRVYKVVDGKRKQLQTVEVKTETGTWYALKAVMAGDHIKCFLDGKPLLDVRDDTFKDAGMVGLWTKADASTSFDDFTVRSPRGGDEAEREDKVKKAQDKDEHAGAKHQDEDDDDHDDDDGNEHASRA
ncbi:MAG: PepSY domain-containing protein [Planctomycetota bacterium]